jgi:hypothetical protein
MSSKLLWLVLVAALLAACGDDPLSYSGPVGINLKVKSTDVATAISEEKSITTEVGNPYGAFVADARARLGNKDPARIEINSLSLLVGGDSKKVTQLDQVFSGQIEFLFVVDDSKNSYMVGTLQTPTGTGTFNVAVSFRYSQLAAIDTAKFIAGGFKVVLRGPAAAGFKALDAEASLQATFNFEAY